MGSTEMHRMPTRTKRPPTRTKQTPTLTNQTPTRTIWKPTRTYVALNNVERPVRIARTHRVNRINGLEFYRNEP